MLSYQAGAKGGLTVNDSYEAVIIGGGPAGLTAGIYLMRAGVGTMLLEKQMVGGAALNTERIENYPGFPDGISGSELMGRMAEQARKAGTRHKGVLPRRGRRMCGRAFRDRGR